MKLLYMVLALSACAFGQHVNLSWTAPPAPACGPVTGYNLYRATASGTQDFTAPLNTALITGTTYTDSAVSYGATYYYKVKALDGVPCGNGVSAPSAEVLAVIPAQVIIINPAPPVLAAPQVVIP